MLNTFNCTLTMAEEGAELHDFLDKLGEEEQPSSLVLEWSRLHCWWSVTEDIGIGSEAA